MLRIVLISFAFLAIKLESASFPDYAPFAQNEKPKRYRVVELAHWPTSEHKIEFGITVNSVRLLEVLQEDNGTSLAMFKGSGPPVVGPVRVSRLVSGLSPPRAYQADLNRDGEPDYIVEIYSGGNGIARCYSNVVFVVSSNRQYATTVFKADCPSEDDLVDLFGDGRFQYIQPTFVFGSEVKGKDGRVHNYWVYNIYALEGASFKLQNSLRTGFPKWIMYAGIVNHRATEQLTAEQKQLLWKPYEECLVSVLGDTCLIR